MIISRRSLLATASICALATPAFAQTVEQSPVVEEVVVTGTRIVRNGYEAPTPVSVVGTEEIASSAAPNLADFVNTLPSISGSTTPENSTKSVSPGTGGLANINLRALGSGRTLVLLDGQRSVGSVVTGQVDVNNIPQALVARVDVVTGGASAAYGSDALSGVVNFVLDKTFTGIKGEASGGVTTYGDDRNWKLNLTAGLPFADGRGHFLISGEADYNAGIWMTTRDWNLQGNKIMLNPTYSATNGQPAYLVVTHAGIDQGSPGGIITSGPLKGIEFGPGGVPRQFNYGALTRDPYTVGGDWQETIEDMFDTLDPLIRRQGLFTRAAYDVTEDINLFVQASWNASFAASNDARPYDVANISIKPDNAFIPASVAAQVQALKLTSLQMGTFHADLGPFGETTDRITNRYVVGGSGKFDAMDTRWTWDAYFQVGRTRADEKLTNVYHKAQMRLAMDAVRNPNGVIVCRSTLTNPGDGCVPYNVFGIGVNSQAALNYLTADPPHRNEQFLQHAMAANLRGEPFSDWAGPVSLSMGIEHRMESTNGQVSAQDAANNNFVGNYLPNIGHYDVTEGFVETVVPLAKETSWAKVLDLNAAVRATGYSVSGYVTTWKAGLSYTPIDDLRFRVTRSRDIRAPNLSELFQAGTANTNTIIDPFNNNAPIQYQGFAVGNLALQPEKADTLGLGVVVQPTFFPGFNASVDYYRIAINDAIGSVGAQDIVNLCYEGQQQFCGAITRGTNNGIPIFSRIVTTNFNYISQLARGLDFEASYVTALSAINSDWNGNFALRALATHFLDNRSDTGVPGQIPTNSVGSNSANGPPNWRYLVTATYANDPINFSLTARGISAGTYDNSWIQCTSGCPAATTNHETVNDNHLDGYLYFDVAFSYNFGAEDSGSKKEVFLTIRNIMNTDPVAVHQGPLSNAYKNIGINKTLYDGLGRVFRAGIRFKM